jgi:hypothetical protein
MRIARLILSKILLFNIKDFALCNFLRRHIRARFCITQNPKLARWSSAGLKSAQGSNSVDALLLSYSSTFTPVQVLLMKEREPNTRTRSTPKVAIAMRVHNVQYNRAARINQPPCCCRCQSERIRCMLKFFHRSGDEKNPGPLIRLLLCAHKTLCTKHRPRGYYVLICAALIFQ